MRALGMGSKVFSLSSPYFDNSSDPLKRRDDQAALVANGNYSLGATAITFIMVALSANIIPTKRGRFNLFMRVQ
jgi:hypothetical protein